MRKRLFLGLSLIIGAMIVFVVGYFLGGRISKDYLAREFNRANMPVVLSHYEIFRGIARSIKEGDYSIAKCRADLGASSKLDEIRECMSDQHCRRSIESEIENRAPEVLARAPLGFDYLENSNGIRSCEQREHQPRAIKGQHRNKN